MRIAEYYTQIADYAQALEELEPAEQQMLFIVQNSKLQSDYEMLYYLLDQFCEIKTKARDVSGAMEYKLAADELYKWLWNE